VSEEREPLLEGTLISHLLELRDRLLRAFIAVIIVFCPCMYYSNQLFEFLSRPLREQLPAGGAMIATTVTAPFMVPFKLAFITALILAAAAGSSMAAELGTMSVADELAALEVLSVDRVRFLVLPRLVALVLAAPVLTILCDTIGILGGGFVAQSQLNVSFELYTDSALEALRDLGTTFPLPKDVFGGLFKACVFGAIVALIGCSAGLNARGGALGVGRATRQAVLVSIIAIIIANYFMTWFMYQG